MPIVWILQQIIHRTKHIFRGPDIVVYWYDMHELWNKIWRDKNGRIIIWQLPNAPLLAWLVLTFASLLVNGRPADVLYWLGSAALIIWALLELFKGVNYFRRALGLLVLVMAVVSVLKNF